MPCSIERWADDHEAHPPSRGGDFTEAGVNPGIAHPSPHRLARPAPETSRGPSCRRHVAVVEDGSCGLPIRRAFRSPGPGRPIRTIRTIRLGPAGAHR